MESDGGLECSFYICGVDIGSQLRQFELLFLKVNLFLFGWLLRVHNPHEVMAFYFCCLVAFLFQLHLMKSA